VATAQRHEDGSGFATSTRRRFGLLAGGMTASLLGLTGFPDNAGAKKGKGGKKRSRRARQEQTTTTPPAPICAGLGGTCTPGQSLCCGTLLCIGNPIQKDTVEFTCCKGQGQPCSAPSECCAGLLLTCTAGICQPAPKG
jgi:hypothetical protein